MTAYYYWHLELRQWSCHFCHSNLLFLVLKHYCIDNHSYCFADRAAYFLEHTHTSPFFNFFAVSIMPVATEKIVAVVDITLITFKTVTIIFVSSCSFIDFVFVRSLCIRLSFCFLRVYSKYYVRQYKFLSLCHNSHLRFGSTFYIRSGFRFFKSLL